MAEAEYRLDRLFGGKAHLGRVTPELVGCWWGNVTGLSPEYSLRLAVDETAKPH